MDGPWVVREIDQPIAADVILEWSPCVFILPVMRQSAVKPCSAVFTYSEGLCAQPRDAKCTRVGEGGALRGWFDARSLPKRFSMARHKDIVVGYLYLELQLLTGSWEGCQ